MALTERQQIFELIKKSRSILIVFKKDWTSDTLASALALFMILKKIDKRVEVVCQDFKPSANVSFLGATAINDKIESLQKFVVSINTSQTEVGEFYYDHSHNKLNIYLSPKSGQFKPEDVAAKIANYEYDLILAVNSPDLESLGEIYGNHRDFFYTTPKINIDNSPKNEYYGDINIVDLASSSTAEIIYGLINNLDENLIDAKTATCLLAGIIAGTKNFKSSKVTPKTLNTAGLLIAQGANREQIIQNFYQTRFLSTLKLWGRVLARLNNDLDDKLVWSTIADRDFLETATSPDEIIDVIDELIVSLPKIEVIVLIYQQRANDEIEVLAYSAKNLDALFISQRFNPSGNAEIARFRLNKITLSEAERMVIGEIKHKLQ